MSEAVASGSKIGTAIKWVFTSVFGLASGAVLMYLTPLVNHAVKPPEPVANFGFQAQGLNVTLQNRSTTATDGWWDFGDGSALEPFSPKQEMVSHAYTKAGSYMVKLSLTNLFNEKSERTVTVNVDNTNSTAPIIEQLEVIPGSPGMPAPAFFQIKAKVKNADQLIWIYDGARPTEITTTDTTGEVEKWVTAKDPGRYTFRLAAMNGKQIVEMAGRPQLVSASADPGTPMALVKVAYTDAVQLERKEMPAVNVRLAWPTDCRDGTCVVHGDWQAPGWQIVKAELAGDGKDAHLKGIPKVAIAPDKSKVLVTAEMQRPSLINKFISQSCAVPVKVTLEKRHGSGPKEFNLPMALNVPGKTTIPVPGLSSCWQAGKAVVTLDVKEGARSIWSGTTMPNNVQTELKGRRVLMSATVQSNQLVVTVTDRGGVVPVGYPVKP